MNKDKIAAAQRAKASASKTTGNNTGSAKLVAPSHAPAGRPVVIPPAKSNPLPGKSRSAKST
jgi:hypothetical protein